MIARDLVRWLTAARGDDTGGGRSGALSPGVARRPVRGGRAAWRGGGVAPVRARVPGVLTELEPAPGGGLVRFARSELYVRVTVRGALFLGWDGAAPLPSYALTGAEAVAPDERVVLEPDTEGGVRLVSERLGLTVARDGTVEVRTPGGVMLRRQAPPRWWEAAGSVRGGGRWVSRAEVAADAVFLGAGRDGAVLAEGAYTVGGVRPGLRMPVQVVQADAGCHLVFHDAEEEGEWLLRPGREGAGSGHDRAGVAELRMSGGPVRSWVVVGSPQRLAYGWASLTGAPVPPPGDALGGAGRELVVVRGGGGPGAVEGCLTTGRRRGFGGGAGPRGRFGGSGEVTRGFGAGAGLTRVFRAGAGLTRRFGGGAGRDAGAGVPEWTDSEVRAREGERYVAFAGQGRHGFVHSFEGMGGVLELCRARAVFNSLRGAFPGERPLQLAVGVWAGQQRYGGVCLPGPEAGDWAELPRAVGRVLGLGLCGVPFCGPGVPGTGDGGRGARGGEVRTPGVRTPGVRTPGVRTRGVRASGVRRSEGSLSDEDVEWAVRWEQLARWLPWSGGAEGGSAGGAASGERERWGPYWTTLARHAGLWGGPWVRPVWWFTPEDRALRGVGDAFLVGEALLVAPVCEPGVRSRRVRLPKGQWYDTATEVVYEGERTVEVAAPLDRVPVLVRAGAVIPVREAGGTVLDVWAPLAESGPGAGLYIPDEEGGWSPPLVERYTSRLGADGEVVVERSGGPGAGPGGASAAGRPVRVRGLGAAEAVGPA
ncbi:TIM-barrel domain-containing protein [Streptomyces sp. NPDC060243]|uniref:TIM-barrel domain-containing protein n=1 Tax=Streptomyces sp. NPDC060243 TaxID=3347081 RepID=UPI00365E7F67